MLDMLLAAREAQTFVEGVTWEQFIDDRLLQRGLVNALQEIGEAARAVSATTKAAHPEVPWVDIVNMRHRLVHDYRRINVHIVWETVQHSVPALIAALEPLIPPADER